MPVYTTDNSKKYLEMLQKHFPDTVTFEKHPRAMMSVIFDRTFEKVLGKNFKKKRISKRKEEKLYAYLLEQLRIHYGRFINLTNFKIKSPNNIRFTCNLSHAFKNKLGVIFAPTRATIGTDVLYTRHCFERFEERVDPEFNNKLKMILTTLLKAEPTAADIVFACMDLSSYSYAYEKRFWYVDLCVGALVLEEFPEFYLAKTFLSPEMIIRKPLQWYKPDLTQEQELHTGRYFHSLRSVLGQKPVEIPTPTFGIAEFMYRFSKHEEPNEF